MKKQLCRKWILVGIFYLFVLVICKWIFYDNMDSTFKNVSLQIDYEVNNNGVFQVYYNNLSPDSPFDEANTKVYDLKTHSDTLQVEIPFNRIQKIRIDFRQFDSPIIINRIDVKLFGITLASYAGQALIDAFSEVNNATLLLDNNQVVVTLTDSTGFIVNTNMNVQKPTAISLFLTLVVSTIITICTIFVLHHSIPPGVKKSIVREHKKLFLIALFLAFLIVPPFLGKLAQSGVSIESRALKENRTLKEKPVFSLETIGSYPKEYEAYYNDNLPFKHSFVKLSSYIKYNLLHISAQDTVIIGKDDWLFYNSKAHEDGDTLADFRGTNYNTPQELEDMKQALLEKQEYLDSQGIEFHVFIAPNKASIYGQYMPSYYKQAEVTKTDRLVDYLRKETDVSIIYPKNILLEQSEKYETYQKNDTHWNEIGGYIGFQELMKNIEKDYLPINLESIPITSHIVSSGDLSTKINAQEWTEDNAYTLDYKSDIIPELLESDTNAWYKYQSNSTNNKKLLMFRDSFTNNMIPYLTKEFSESAFNWSRYFDKELIEKEKPDVVVIEVVERAVDQALLN